MILTHHHVVMKLMVFSLILSKDIAATHSDGGRQRCGGSQQMSSLRFVSMTANILLNVYCCAVMHFKQPTTSWTTDYQLDYRILRKIRLKLLRISTAMITWPVKDLENICTIICLNCAEKCANNCGADEHGSSQIMLIAITRQRKEIEVGLAR